jgi:hypothetical protein
MKLNSQSIWYLKIKKNQLGLICQTRNLSHGTGITSRKVNRKNDFDQLNLTCQTRDQCHETINSWYNKTIWVYSS